MADLRDYIRAGRGEYPAEAIITGGKLVNVASEEIYPADIAVWGGRIMATGDVTDYRGPKTEVIDAAGQYLVPGMIDGHLHVECSKMSITSFAGAVVPLGTTSIVSGLDQILVTAGLDGARAFLDEAAGTALRIFWGAPCKTPYTMPRSNVGHYFGPKEHAATHEWPECVGIWETVREFVQELDPDVLAAIELAERNRLPVLGCSPMCCGTKLNSYLQAGVRSDHESYTAPEFAEKLRKGVHVVIRESSISHFLTENLRVLTEMGISASRRISFCTDDVVATDILARGHLDNMVRMAIAMGIPPMTAIQMATLNGAEALRIDGKVGVIAPGRAADVLFVDDLREFHVRRVMAKGRMAAEDGALIDPAPPPARAPELLQTIRLAPVTAADFAVPAPGAAAAADAPAPAAAPALAPADGAVARARVMAMAVTPGQIFVRKRRDVTLAVSRGTVAADQAQDVQYVSVIERYGRTKNRPVGFVSGFGLRSGAMASSTAPDDNNIVCVGTSAEDMAVAVNRIIELGGGQVVVDGGRVLEELALPIGGIVSDLPAPEMAAREQALDEAARSLGCALPWPFMYMFVLQITAIPDYAITDLGVIDCVNLKVVEPVTGPA